ncbi:hypothetical protein [Amedibacterium intestinale]|uniref:hypothetical protein n=1 Tax=Amedibacterium intestinale TaxID=2583452 RepID=UPI000E54A85A|nr:hypothetical protein [Amedibacterium intestinale]RHO20863.1 hypothetical protein DW220_08615 [Eubacterium sp. AM18-26]RHO24835.1 hypothetical protein DW212_08825 [Eubacterium sp. AM18-10LB-B]BBK62041.1 hypothetical protein A9CBEGH2_09810 [Amedibacterium intestinale]
MKANEHEYVKRQLKETYFFLALSICLMLSALLWFQHTSLFMAGAGGFIALLPRFKKLKQASKNTTLARELKIEANDERNQSIDKRASQFAFAAGIILITIICFIMDLMGRKDISFILSFILLIQLLIYILLHFYYHKKN